MIDQVALELKHALRGLLRSPLFSLTVVLTLALGIGATSGIFSVLNAVVLKPLPYPEPERVQYLGWQWKEGVPLGVLSPIKFRVAQEHLNAFEHLATSQFVSAESAVADGNPVILRGRRVSAGWLDVLGFNPQLGRGFVAEELQHGGRPVVVLGHRVWNQLFQQDPQIIGRSMVLNGRAHQIVGVLPRDYIFVDAPDSGDFLLPLVLTTDPTDATHNYEAIGRLQPDTSLAQAQAQLGVLNSHLATHFPGVASQGGGGGSFRIADFQTLHVGDSKNTLWLIFAAVALVLLIAVANVASLFMARLASRRGEWALRMALGAGRGRMIGQMMAEAFVLAVAGGVVGLLVAALSLNVLLATTPSLPRMDEIGIDLRVLAFTAGVALASALLPGLAAALLGNKADLSSNLKEGPRTSGIGKVSARARGLLVAAQAALAMILLTGAALLVTSLGQLRAMNLGFEVESVVVAGFQRVPQRYQDPEPRRLFTAQLLQAASTLPRVDAVAVVSSVPFQTGLNIPVSVANNGSSTEGVVEWRAVSSEYFDALTVPMLRGRRFGVDDSTGSAPVAIVNQAFAQQHFPGGDPIGQRLSVGYFNGSPMLPGWENEEPARQIVGVVGDMREIMPHLPAKATVYVPYRQVPDTLTRNFTGMPSLLIRTPLPVADATTLIATMIRQADPMLPQPEIRPLQDSIGAALRQEQSNARLMGTYAALAMLLTAVGLYGLLGYHVAVRSREIGVRLVLGATSAQVARLIVRQGLMWIVLGVVAGLLVVSMISGVMDSLLFGVESTDWKSRLLAAVVVLTVSLLATLLPALRAACTHPVQSLRSS